MTHEIASSGGRTPALALNTEALRRNLARMQRMCANSAVALRPHAKGHKSPWIAARQVALGATGVAAATPAEALNLLRYGIDDVLKTSVLGPVGASLAVEAARLGRLAVVAGDVVAVRILSAAGRDLSETLRVLIDVDVGQRRGGVADADTAAAVAEAITEAPNLELVGVQGYDGHIQGIADPRTRREAHAAAMSRLAAAVARVRTLGCRIDWVTSAGTATAPFALDTGGLVTEIQPGSYALMDASYSRVMERPFETAVTVVTAVITVLGATEVIVDAGGRAVSTDLGPPEVVGYDAEWKLAGDEHGRIIGRLDGLAVGDLLALVPSHSDTTVPLYDGFLVHGAPQARIPIVRE